jgi:hypothetical protein
MAEKKLVRWTIALAAALVLVIAAGYSYWTRGVYVKITNNTQNTLKHIDITYSVGVIHIAELVPGASYGRYVNPKGGSDLSLEWSDFSGSILLTHLVCISSTTTREVLKSLWSLTTESQ